MALLLSVAITVAVVAAGTGNAATIVGHDRQSPMFQSWVDAAAPLVPVPNIPVEVIQQPCRLRSRVVQRGAWTRRFPTRAWTGTNSAYLWELRVSIRIAIASPPG